MPMGGVELLILLVIILLFFGARRVPELGRSLGVGARELKKAASEDADESETKEASAKEASAKVASAKVAAEDKTKMVSEDAPSARDEDRAGRKAPDQ
jgi:sec-independent protein translocase protein TatA